MHEQCGWLRDKFGVSWQVAPAMIAEILQSGESAKVGAMMRALMQMSKLDIAALQKAFDDG